MVIGVLTFNISPHQRKRSGVSKMSRFWSTLAVWMVVCVGAALGQGQEEVLHYQIQEESEINAFVGNVARDSKLYSRFSQDEFQQLQYSISSRSSKFKIDDNTSTLRTLQVLDRENECQFNAPSEPCEIEFDVGVYKWDESIKIYDLFMIVHVTVVLEDINDNSPEFPKDVVYLSVPESVPVGHVLLTSGAVDTDTGDNSLIEYRLVPESDTFRLQVMNSVDGLSSDLGIVVQQSLDRERQSGYQMQVVATDGGFPQRSGTVNISINVQDVNDNEPSFTKDVFNITVDEGSPTSVPILKLVATDPDSSQNGALTFAFSSRTSQKIMDQFAVDPSNGEVILTKPLDFEKDKRLQFMVVVKDHGSPERQSQAAVIVNVADVNDNAPQIDITLPPGGTNIAESIEVGSFIAHVSLSDADDGRNGEIACSVTNRHFRLEKFSDFSYIFKILLEKNLDYEVARQHLVNVTCSDKGSPPLHNSSSFIIHVRDENDNAPIFSKPEYHISVRENMVPGLFVFQVIAMDPDTGNNGNLTYFLLDNPESAFSIDTVSGNLRAMKMFDRESRGNYRLVVEAKDKGSPPMSSTAVVNVEIDDVNDSPTHFARPHFDFYVEEEQRKGTIVDTLRVVDLDNMASGQLQFSFLPEFSAPAEFSIDVYTGQITTNKPLDRENPVNVFNLKVFVVDAENVMFNDSATVTVTVTDINDHAPNITFPSEKNHTVRLPYTMPAGSIVTTVLAHDQDRGENGSSGMTYELESGDTKDMFLMNGINGQLILTRRLESRDVGTYKLRVSVQDSGRVEQKKTIAGLHVVVTHSNSSGLFSTGGHADHNVAIVVTLVCVTVALALAVLATICIIRRIDRERKHHSGTKVEEQNIYKQETLPPASVEEKTPTMENYENEIEKLKRKIKRELSFVTDDDMLDSSESNGTTSASFSTFRKASPGSATGDSKILSSPQACSSVLQSSSAASPESYTSAGIKRVHYVDRARELNRLGDSPSPQHGRQAASPTGLSWTQQQPRSGNTGLTVRTEGEDASSHTSGSTSDSGRGGSSEDDVNTSQAGVCLGSDSGDDLRLHSVRSYHGNPSLSTFRSPSSLRQTGDAGGLSSNHNISSTGLNSHLTTASPRSYLQAQQGSNTYQRNVSFSDDNPTVADCHSRQEKKSSGMAACPQQEQQRWEPTGREEAISTPRSILSKDSLFRYRTAGKSKPQSGGSVGRALAYGQHHNQHHRHSPPLPIPPDMSPLENRSGDDVYGVGLRGKTVNFSVGDSYKMTPRRTGSTGRLYTPPPLPSQQSSGVEAVGGHVYANRTAQSSLGQPYSLSDMDDALPNTPVTTAATADDEDRTTTTSGSYTINADDLCNEIDHLFFNDAVV